MCGLWSSVNWMWILCPCSPCEASPPVGWFSPLTAGLWTEGSSALLLVASSPPRWQKPSGADAGAPGSGGASPACRRPIFWSFKAHISEFHQWIYLLQRHNLLLQMLDPTLQSVGLLSPGGDLFLHVEGRLQAWCRHKLIKERQTTGFPANSDGDLDDRLLPESSGCVGAFPAPLGRSSADSAASAPRLHAHPSSSCGALPVPSSPLKRLPSKHTIYIKPMEQPKRSRGSWFHQRNQRENVELWGKISEGKRSRDVIVNTSNSHKTNVLGWTSANFISFKAKKKLVLPSGYHPFLTLHINKYI